MSSDQWINRVENQSKLADLRAMQAGGVNQGRPDRIDFSRLRNNRPLLSEDELRQRDQSFAFDVASTLRPQATDPIGDVNNRVSSITSLATHSDRDEIQLALVSPHVALRKIENGSPSAGEIEGFVQSIATESEDFDHRSINYYSRNLVPIIAAWNKLSDGWHRDAHLDSVPMDDRLEALVRMTMAHDTAEQSTDSITQALMAAAKTGQMNEFASDQAADLISQSVNAPELDLDSGNFADNASAIMAMKANLDTTLRPEILLPGETEADDQIVVQSGSNVGAEETLARMLLSDVLQGTNHDYRALSEAKDWTGNISVMAGTVDLHMYANDSAILNGHEPRDLLNNAIPLIRFGIRIAEESTKDREEKYRYLAEGLMQLRHFAKALSPDQ